MPRLPSRSTQPNTSNIDFVSKIDNIRSVVKEIESSVSKYGITLHDVNNKLRTVSEQLGMFLG